MKSQSDFKNLPTVAQWTVILFAMAGLAALLYAIRFQPMLPSSRVMLLVASACVGASMKVNLFRSSTLSYLTPVVLLAVIQEGPAIAVLVGLCGVTVQTIFPSRRIVLHQLAFNAGMIAVTVIASWFTYHALVGSPSLHTISSEMMATVLASFTYFLGNSISVSLIVALSKGMSIFHVWFQHFLFSAPSFVIAGLFSLGMMAMISRSSGFAIAAALMIAISVAYSCAVRMAAQPEA